MVWRYYWQLPDVDAPDKRGHDESSFFFNILVMPRCMRGTHVRELLLAPEGGAPAYFALAAFLLATLLAYMARSAAAMASETDSPPAKVLVP